MPVPPSLKGKGDRGKGFPSNRSGRKFFYPHGFGKRGGGRVFAVALCPTVCYNTLRKRGDCVRILGIDPGYAIVGFGLIETGRGRPRMKTYGAITTPAELPLSKRLLQIDRDMERLLDALQPDVVAVERLFFNTNHTTGIAVAHGRGVILCATERYGVPLCEYTPSQVKISVTGYGKADKRQVMDMTRRILKLDAVPKPDDAADALSVALCHARSATSRLPRSDSGGQTV